MRKQFKSPASGIRQHGYNNRNPARPFLHEARPKKHLSHGSTRERQGRFKFDPWEVGRRRAARRPTFGWSLSQHGYGVFKN